MHRARRIEELAAPILIAALADANLSPADVDEVIIGNATQGGNPARLVALAAGLPDKVPATTIDRQCASGLDAIIHAARSIAAGDASVVIAGGAESLSTAPWRVARPRMVHQQPRFIGAPDDLSGGDMPSLDAHDRLAERSQISRKAQDGYAFATRQRAVAAHEARCFKDEIVALKVAIPEFRDESLVDGLDLDDLAELPVLSNAVSPTSGAVTAGNTALGHDAAAFVVIVSQAVWERLGKPPALVLVLGSAVGAETDEAASAPVQAILSLYARLNGFPRERITAIELNEASAAQAISFRDSLGFSDAMLNRDGGALARGAAAGAGSAALVVRLFTRLVRERKPASREPLDCGIAVSGAVGGLGVAALFEGV